MAVDEEEAVRMEGAARLALAEAETVRRKEWAAAAQERQRLRAEIRELQERIGATGDSERVPPSSTSPAAKRARRHSPGGAVDLAPPSGGMSRTQAYARFHEAEAALRAEQDKSAGLEASLGKLLGEMQQKLPIYRERSARLGAALDSHAEVSTRCGAALRERDAAVKTAEEVRVEVAAVRATLADLTEQKGVKRGEVELREALHKEQLGVATRVAEAERPLRTQLEETEREAKAARADCDEARGQNDELTSQAERWRVLYEASTAAASVAQDGTAAGAPSSTAEATKTLAEVRALLREGVTGQARAQIARLEKELAAARKRGAPASADEGGSAGNASAAADAAALQAKLKLAEATAEKMRKAAGHWKAQHTQLKQVHDQSVADAAAAQAAAPAAADGEASGETSGASSEALSAAEARVAALEAEMANVATAKAELEATLEKYRKAATHWKRQYDKLNAPASE